MTLHIMAYSQGISSSTPRFQRENAPLSRTHTVPEKGGSQNFSIFQNTPYPTRNGIYILFLIYTRGPNVKMPPSPGAYISLLLKRGAAYCRGPHYHAAPAAAYRGVKYIRRRGRDGPPRGRRKGTRDARRCVAVLFPPAGGTNLKTKA